jgi:hypothetical protein
MISFTMSLINTLGTPLTSGETYGTPSGMCLAVGTSKRKFKCTSLAGIDHGKLTDHRDRNGLNNQLHNLRPATSSQNGHNRPKNKRNKSGYKGVFFSNTYHKWYAKIMVNGKSHVLGSFQTPEEGALAYNAAAKLLVGEFAYINDVPLQKE